MYCDALWCDFWVGGFILRGGKEERRGRRGIGERLGDWSMGVEYGIFSGIYPCQHTRRTRECWVGAGLGRALEETAKCLLMRHECYGFTLRPMLFYATSGRYSILRAPQDRRIEGRQDRRTVACVGHDRGDLASVFRLMPNDILMSATCFYGKRVDTRLNVCPSSSNMDLNSMVWRWLADAIGTEGRKMA